MRELIGHDRVVHELRETLEAGRLPHALLLVGPDGVGKGTLARELAQTINCVGVNPPCGVCVHCRQIALGSHPDVTVIGRGDGRESIAIGQVRALRDDASLRPYQGAHKVYIVSGAEGLTAQASDALLKTLEEPPPHVTIILIAADAESVPATVASRCRILTLRPVPADRIARALGDEIGQEEAQRIARLSRGSVGWALQAARQPKLVEQQAEAVSALLAVPDMDMRARLQLAETLAAERKDRSQLRRSLELLLLLARDLIFVGQGLPPQAAPADAEGTLRAQANRLGLAQLERYVEGIRLAMERIDANVDPRLALEAFLMGLP